MKNHLKIENTNLTEIISDAMSAAHAYGTALPGRKALAETPGKLLKFLYVAGNDPNVGRALRSVGYTPAVHELGWKRLREAGADRKGASKPEPSEGDKALAVLEGWIGPNFRRAQAMLKYEYPQQEAYVFRNLRNIRGPEAIMSVATFLARLDNLESSPHRKATRTVDHEALHALATCGITEDERKRVGAIVAVFETLASYLPAPNERAQTRSLLAAHAYLAKWSELARTVITNRTILISMGIGKRRTRGAASSAPQLPAAGHTTSTDSVHIQRYEQ